LVTEIEMLKVVLYLVSKIKDYSRTLSMLLTAPDICVMADGIVENESNEAIWGVVDCLKAKFQLGDLEVTKIKACVFPVCCLAIAENYCMNYTKSLFKYESIHYFVGSG
jgi:hypothetical protein